ncbi:MAG: hypothetical protein RI885_1277 [Actinomycetota bacterium]|jgi:5,10-methylenetetrahydrofolate reductase
MPDAQTAPVLESCPKHMEYGPCGGVQFDGSCEVSTARCVFVDAGAVRWHGITGSIGAVAASPRTGAADAMTALLRSRPIVVADLPARALDAASIVEAAGILRGSVDAVLAGDAGPSRVQFPPAYRAHLIRQSGLAVWSGVNCRDRNRVALEGELAGLADAGASAVHCVTGDHTLTGSRPDAQPVFDLDSTGLASLAADAGHLVSVAESPLAPPIGERPARLLEKQRAGAHVCFVNHAGGVEPVDRFIRSSRALGVSLDFIACVPVVVDRESAELLLSFTTLALPDGYLEGILAADDTFRAGVDAAVAFSRRLLEVEGVRGINLSGGTPSHDKVRFAEGLAAIAEGVQS